ncbi:hypothetical protein DFS34DRAFT_602195 [Phlyctochytrium arcticum]|nr:hypothetical protein DFS34DRAFT_602195 [Phlyctochytrium arcticum]
MKFTLLSVVAALVLTLCVQSSLAVTDDDRLTDEEVESLQTQFGTYSQPQSLSADERAALLAFYAPLVQLHPRDRWKPADPQETFKASKLDKDNRTLIVPPELWHGNGVQEGGIVKAKIVGHVVQHGPGNKTYLQYWFFYPVNGCQGFRSGIWSGLKSFVREGIENFEWCGIAYHNGDWEHITVQLDGVWLGGTSETIPPLERIAMSQHSAAEWLPASTFRFVDQHPIIYAALHSHANYANEGTHKNIDDTFAFVSRISPVLTLGSVQYIMIADVVDLQTDLFTYDQPDGRRYTRFLAWNTWDGIYDWSDRLDWGEFARFSGYWGTPVDQTTILKPPQGVTARNQLLAVFQAASKFGILDKFVRKAERAPKGPRQHRSWYTLDFPPLK